MFGCLRRLGCLAIILLLGVAAWFTRDRWYSRVFGAQGGDTVTWQAATPTGARRAQDAIESLGATSGPVFTNLTASQLASLLTDGAQMGLPGKIDSVEAVVVGDLVRVRARIQLDDVRALDALGPLARMLNKRERIELSGRLNLVRPGLAEYALESAQLGELPIPKVAIPKLLARVGGANRPVGLSPEGLPIPVPSYVGDIRVAQGKITLYKTVK